MEVFNEKDQVQVMGLNSLWGGGGAFIGFFISAQFVGVYALVICGLTYSLTSFLNCCSRKEMSLEKLREIIDVPKPEPILQQLKAYFTAPACLNKLTFVRLGCSRSDKLKFFFTHNILKL